MDLTIIWWHGIEGDLMFYFVDEANVAPYRSYCSKVLEELRDNLDNGTFAEYKKEKVELYSQRV